MKKSNPIWRELTWHFRKLIKEDRTFLDDVQKVCQKQLDYLREKNLERTGSYHAFESLNEQAEALIFKHALATVKFQEKMAGSMPVGQTELTEEAV
jgi:hypothetical protein